jgi:transglutaminase-like putative cysteine protease
VLICRVGCEFVYSSTAPTPAVAQVQVHPADGYELRAERRAFSLDLPHHEYHDSFGNRCLRFTIPEGGVTFRYDALVMVTSDPDPVVPDAPALPIEDLPDNTLQFLLPSRYCDSDRLQAVAWELFGDVPAGWARVQAICDWVHTRVTFLRGSVGLATALDVYLARKGVCRDFAHLGVALCRAMNIPARYGFGYMGDIGIEAMPAPMDFHAWFEVYLGDRWYTFDCRHNMPRIGRIFIGRGRDAADVAMITSFGPAVLDRMTVWADEVGEATTLDD